MAIKKAAVFGSGVMGSAIAAQIASADIQVYLFDIVPDGATNRNQLADAAIERMLKTDPSPFTHPSKAKNVIAANISDHLGELKNVDWIIEAVIERIDIKHDVYRKIDANRKAGSIVSSNTSTIPLQKLIEGMSEKFQEDFIITHFFNPPRFMRLLELVGGPKSRKSALEEAKEFCDIHLGKSVVDCKDTPGFIANRIGCFWLEVALREAIKLGVTVEEADAIMSRPVGIPKTGVFGLFDLIGLDLMPLIAKAFSGTLPKDDSYLTMYQEVPLYTQMIREGYTGRKGKGGFYRINKIGDKKIKEVKDLKTGEYKPEQAVKLESLEESRKGLAVLVMHPDRGGKYAWAVLSETLRYAASLMPQIADDITSVDETMRSGYNWKYGPFQLIDMMGGPKWFSRRLEEEGRPVPEIIKVAGDRFFYNKLEYLNIDGKTKTVLFNKEAWTLEDIKINSKPVLQNNAASLWDVGDGVACLELTTKMNAVEAATLDLINKSIDKVKHDFKALIIGGDSDYVSAGANLSFFLENAKLGNWQAIEDVIKHGQETYMALKYAPFPSVGAATGIALGGGCELMLHCSAVVAHIEFYPGLVEVNVGLIPGWGGCKEMLLRHKGDSKKAFELISKAVTAKSAEDAKDMGIIAENSRITINRRRLLADAKKIALDLSKDYKASTAQTISVTNSHLEPAGSDHDKIIQEHLIKVLTGDGKKEVSEHELLNLEGEAFMQLVKLPKSIERIEFMLKNGKPLRN